MDRYREALGDYLASERREVHRTSYDRDGGSLSATIAEALASVLDESVTELRPPLGTVIDADALERVIGDRSGPDGTVDYVGFTYREFEVVVFADGGVRVYEPSRASSRADTFR